PIKGERKPKPPNEGPKIPPVPKRKTNENPPPAPNERKQVEPQVESGGGAASCTRGRGTPPAFSQLDDLLKQPNAKTKEFIMILEEVTIFINLLEDELKKAHALDTPEKKIEVNKAIENLRIKVQREEFIANYCSDIISGNTPAEQLNLLKQDLFNRYKKLLEPRLKKEVNEGTILKREVEGKWRYFKRRVR
ncbi:MAG: hypothetical protein KGO83_02530, partial [Paenibacillaceae bacterium]|nr:hypothetical protein [Paenibacillaceae bacterium]